MNAGLQIGFAQDGMNVLFNEVGLPFFHNEEPALSAAEGFEFIVNQRISDIQNIKRNLGLTKCIGQAENFQSAKHAVVQAALHHNAKVIGIAGKKLIELVFLNKFDSSWPAFFDLLLFVQITGRWKHNAIDITFGMLNGIFEREGRAHIVFGRKMAVHVTGANAKLQHDRGIAGLRQLKALLHRFDNAG